jgi:threonine/homoserine/homoserine lactone efflux protein
MEKVVAFVVGAAPIVVAPGPDMALVLPNGVMYGRRAAVATVLGISTELLLLAGVFIAMVLAWLTAYALLVAKAEALLRRPRVRRLVNAVTGTALTALGLRLALDRR